MPDKHIKMTTVMPHIGFKLLCTAFMGYFTVNAMRQESIQIAQLHVLCEKRDLLKKFTEKQKAQ